MIVIRKKFARIIMLVFLISMFVTGTEGALNTYADAEIGTGGVITVDNEILPVYILHKVGNDNESLVILILGDGYTMDEQEKFTDFAAKCANTLISSEPFCFFADKINIYAVPTISGYSGISGINYPVDTYFGVTFYGNRTDFDAARDGRKKAKAIETALETTYLDSGADVVRIHVVSNAEGSFGSAATMGSRQFSFASQSLLYTHGEASLHELGHSIAKLGDEYGKYSVSGNTSNVNDPEDVPWKDILGFRGVGITPNGNAVEGATEINYIPTHSCIMKDTGNARFCEVCKLELVRSMNRLVYPIKFGECYVAEPDVTIEHSNTGAIGAEYDKCRINESNITAANGHNLEFRSIVQNMQNRELRLGIKLQISGVNGDVKRSEEKEFVIKPLTNVYNHEEAAASVSVVLENVEGLVDGDKIFGTIIDKDTNTILATDKTEANGRFRVTIHHKIKDENGQISEMENVMPSSIFIPANGVYYPQATKQMNGYTYIGNSLNSSETVVSDDMDIDFYYSKDKNTIGTKTTFDADKKSFSINGNNIPDGSVVILALYDEDRLSEVKRFIYDGNEIKYITDKTVDGAKVFVWRDTEMFEPICNVEEMRFL